MAKRPVFSAKDGFLGLEKAAKKIDVTVIPFGLEASVSYGSGTSKGPMAIINASHQVELFDEDLWCEPHTNIGIETLKPFTIPKKIPDALKLLDKVTAEVLDAGKFPMILGGEHSLTAGSIRAVVKKYPDVAILHFDAHADLRDGYDGEKYSHAAALRRCMDFESISLVSIGIRNISAGEIPFLEKNADRLKIYWAKDKAKWDVKEIVSHLKGKPIYVSFDLDGFDGSLMPATGTPEPGGIFWNDAIEIIREASKVGNFIGGDVVELAPIKGLHACDFLAAKLAFKIIAYGFLKQK